MKKLVVLLGTLMTCAHALVLEDLIAEKKLLTTFEDKKIGYYIGSFDPVHLGHAALAEEALKNNYCDYVLIFPAWGGDSYKNRSDLSLRHDMLFAAFQEHPRIIVTRLSPLELQQTLTKTTGQTVVPAFKGTQFLGILGSDAALDMTQPQSEPEKESHRIKKLSVFMNGIPLTEKHAKDTIGGIIALPASGYIIGQRQQDDLSVLKGKMADQPIVGILSHDGTRAVSSTQIRERIKKGQPMADLLHPKVAALIQARKLYGLE